MRPLHAVGTGPGTAGTATEAISSPAALPSGQKDEGVGRPADRGAERAAHLVLWLFELLTTLLAWGGVFTFELSHRELPSETRGSAGAGQGFENGCGHQCRQCRPWGPQPQSLRSAHIRPRRVAAQRRWGCRAAGLPRWRRGSRNLNLSARNLALPARHATTRHGAPRGALALRAITGHVERGGAQPGKLGAHQRPPAPPPRLRRLLALDS